MFMCTCLLLQQVIDDPRAQQLYMIQDFMERGPLLPEGSTVTPINVLDARIQVHYHYYCYCTCM
jgi:hypothetical protein